MINFIKKYKYFIGLIILLWLLNEINIISKATRMSGIIDYAKTTSVANDFLLLALVIIVYTNIVIRPEVKHKVILTIVQVIIFLVSLLVEVVIYEEYYFSSDFYACSYSEKCDDYGLLKYSEDNKSTYIKKDILVVYNKDEIGWKIDNSEYYTKYEYEKDGIQIKLIEVEKRYFVYVELKDNIQLTDIIDNSQKEFQKLSVANYQEYIVENHYGKYIDNIKDYKIKIADEEIGFKDFKKIY